MKNILVTAVVTVLVSLIINGCSSNNGAQQKAPPATQVSVYTIKQESVKYFDQYPGTVTPLNQVELRPQVSGYVTKIYFKDGQHVVNGMKLYIVDQQQYKAAYDQAMANLNVAKSNLFKAQQDADRYRELTKNDAVARQILEHSLADLESSKMQVAAAEENVKVVETNLRYSIIYAPFDGTIGISLVKLGSAVSAGQTLLNTISSDNPMAVDFSVDEKQVSRFTGLLDKKTSNNDSTFTLFLPDQTVYPYPGSLSLIDRAIDSQTGTIRVRLVFPNPKNNLRAGLTCNVRIQNESSGGSIVIPYMAVTEQMGEYFVFVVNGNKVTQKRIVLGAHVNDEVIVKDGLQLGDRIVTEGTQRLRDNSLIAVVLPGAKQNTGSPRSN
jgi:membrane fusion protein (multidrug efflux system)